MKGEFMSQKFSRGGGTIYSPERSKRRVIAPLDPSHREEEVDCKGASLIGGAVYD